MADDEGWEAADHLTLGEPTSTRPTNLAELFLLADYDAQKDSSAVFRFA
jgi:hypothetical protein